MSAPRRRGRPAQRLRAYILATHPPICVICGEPVDTTLDGRLPDGPHVHHVEALALAPHREFDPTNLGVTHNRCNLRQGTKPLTPKASRTW